MRRHNQLDKNKRIERVESLIKKELAQIIMQRKDPFIAELDVSFTITHVKVAHDLSYAKVFFILADDNASKIAKTIDLLTQAKGFLQKMLAKTVYLKFIPKLSFVYDETEAGGRRLDEIINKG